VSVVESVSRFGGEVAGVHDDIWRKCANTIEGFQKIRIVNLGTDMDIADLRHPCAFPARRQVCDRQSSFDDLQPMGLDAPGIETGGDREPGRGGGSLQQSAARNFH
jgi:hypothetical protein